MRAQSEIQSPVRFFPLQQVRLHAQASQVHLNPPSHTRGTCEFRNQEHDELLARATDPLIQETFHIQGLFLFEVALSTEPPAQGLCHLLKWQSSNPLCVK